MATALDSVQMAAAVYARTFENKMYLPDGWNEEMVLADDKITGFAAGVYSKGNEVVVGFTGTNETLIKDFVMANIPAALGITSAQVAQAAVLVMDVMRAHPGASISFTGHSLGGGLASVMAVLFDKPAQIFDPAPFEPTVRNPVTLHQLGAVLGLLGPLDPGLQRYVDNGGSDFAAREANVSSWYVQGEVLVPFRLLGSAIADPAKETKLEIGNPSILDTVNSVALFSGGVNLHSVSLLHALLASTAFNAAVKNQPYALEAFFDSGLYARDVERSDEPDFLTRMVMQQIGSTAAGRPATQALDRLAADMSTLQTSGTTGEKTMNLALLAALTEHYQNAAAPSAFFGGKEGYLEFELSGLGVSASRSRALPRLVAAMQSLSNRDRDVLATVGSQQSWHIQTGAGSMAWSDSAGQSDLAVGGTGSDVLRGNAGNDILLGRDGNDTLEGGAGTDALLGGAGHDVYVVGNGIDLVRDDVSGDGTVQTEAGLVLAGGRAAGKPYAWVGASGESYAFIPTSGSALGTLKIGNLGNGSEVRIGNFDLTRALTVGYLGIKLESGLRLTVAEAGAPTPFGDFAFDAAAASGRSTVTEGLGKAYTVFLNTAARAGDTITLSLAGLGDAFRAVLGDASVPAQGAVIALAEGQTQVTFGLVNSGSIPADTSGSLQVSYSGINGAAVSLPWIIDIVDTGVPGHLLDGDGTYATYVASNDLSRDGSVVVARGDSAFQVGGDRNLVAGSGVAISDNVLYGMPVADRINGLAGNDAIDGDAGNDWLDGGAGDDLIAGGAGYNMLIGGLGNDFLLGGGHLDPSLQQLGMNDRWTPPPGLTVYGQGSTWGIFEESNRLTTWDGASDAGSGNAASAILSGEGNDFVIAGPGHDRVDGGPGDDRIDGAGGDDFIEGGDGDDRLQGDGLVAVGYLNTTPVEAHGADFVDGGPGVDDIQGGGGADVLYGGADGDRIWGDSGGRTDGEFFVPLEFHGPDYLDGEDGDDYVEGDGGNDILFGGDGNDTLWGDTPSDYIVGNASGQGAAELATIAYGDDYLDGENGNDRLVGGGGNDELYGGAGDDVLWGDEDSQALADALAGQDRLDGGDGDDELHGGPSTDVLLGGAGIDYLDGGSGADVMAGGPGDDQYEVDDSADLVIEAPGEGNDLVVSSASFALPDNVETLLLDGTDAIDATGNAAGNTLQGNEASNRLDGGEGDDTLIGGRGADVLIGGPGNDAFVVDDPADVIIESNGEGDDFVQTSVDYLLPDNVERMVATGSAGIALGGNRQDNALFGSDGNDVLSGGPGNDVLIGNGGNDIYLFQRGDGHDAISNQDVGSAVDTLRFGPSITESDVVALRAGDHLLLRVKGTSDQIALLDHYASPSVAGADSRIERVEFANGVSWDAAMLQAMVDRSAGNHAPVVSSPLAPVQARAGFVLNQAIATGAFTDPDPGDALVYSATMVDGAPLPDWLHFDATSLTLSGLPPRAGTLNLALWVTDSYGQRAAQAMALDIAETERAPTLVTPLPDQEATVGTAYAWSLPARTFVDPDTEDALTLTASLADGSVLPDWLQFDPTSGRFSGIASNPGKFSVRVTATDPFAKTATDVFDLTVATVTIPGGTSGPDLLSGGPGNDTLTGLAGDDTLKGNAGNDFLDGGPGNDRMAGGTGDDTYVIDSGGDVVTENWDEGIDTVLATITLPNILPANVENLILAGASAINGMGNNLDNTIIGNSAPNLLDGGAGNDVLDGQGGADTLQGSFGDDTYVVDDPGDVVRDDGLPGLDQVLSSISYTLPNYVENLRLIGSAAIDGTGNTLDNLLIGNDAANVLSGASGADTMRGGLGNDTYVVDNVLDVVDEAMNAGLDTILASVAYTLPPNVENLTLAGKGALDGTGNSLANVILGNASANTLAGGAGDDRIDGDSGGDRMLGGPGDDTYVVDTTKDVVIEEIGEGIDTIESSVPLTLPNNVENLILAGVKGNDGVGNALDNLLRGNDGRNALEGGPGTDILEGGTGVDKLTDSSGAALLNGGSGADVLVGGADAQVYIGGPGDDEITTGAGNDIILFNRGDGKDVINTGESGRDTLSLGGGIRYVDMSLSKSKTDLVLTVGNSESITFRDWYAATPSRGVVSLQVIAEAMSDFAAGGSDHLRDQKVEGFDFSGLVGAFDAARAANPALTSWALSNALSTSQQAGSDTAALGGDLAYQYGATGTLAGIGLKPAFALLADPALGSVAQALSPTTSLQAGSVRLT